mmetsp:Transcript_20714/g.47969  ORF Transcript_20714/g.47969 Transcript_20714/m.47969 type:complete len:278 (-) Transcript_20714:226-1059(-)
MDHSPCGPLTTRGEQKTPPPPRPPTLQCEKKPFYAASIGQVMSLPLRLITCPTEAHTSVMSTPPQGPLLGLSRSWQQDTETALIMLQDDPGYPPRKLPTHVPTVRYQDSILQGCEVRLPRKAPYHPPLPPSRSLSLVRLSHIHLAALSQRFAPAQGGGQDTGSPAQASGCARYNSQKGTSYCSKTMQYTQCVSKIQLQRSQKGTSDCSKTVQYMQCVSKIRSPRSQKGTSYCSTQCNTCNVFRKFGCQAPRDDARSDIWVQQRKFGKLGSTGAGRGS